MNEVNINGIDLATFGFVPLRRTLPPLGGEQTQIVRVPGGFPVRVASEIVPAQLVVEGSIVASSHAALVAARSSLVRALRGDCVIRLSDYPDREWVGRLQAEGSRFQFLDPEWITLGGQVTLTFLCVDPRARARAATVRSGSGALVLGDAPSPLRVTGTRNGTVTIRVRAGGASGTILTEMVWAGSGTAFVCDAETYEVSIGGASAVDGLAAGYRFPIADPDAGADYVSITGLTAASVTYRPRWW